MGTFHHDKHAAARHHRHRRDPRTRALHRSLRRHRRRGGPSARRRCPSRRGSGRGGQESRRLPRPRPALRRLAESLAHSRAGSERARDPSPRRNLNRTSTGVRIMNGIVRVPAPVNEPVHSYAPGSPGEGLAQTSPGEDDGRGDRDPADHRRPGRCAPGRSAAASRRTTMRTLLATYHQAGRKEVEQAIAAAGEAWREWSETLVGGARRRAAQGGGSARRAVARHGQRRDDARPVEDGLPGRDRRGLRAGRLLAFQRPLRAGDLRPAAGLDARLSGTWSTTGRSRASSSR